MSEKIPLDNYETFTRHLGDREYFGQRLGLERIRSLLERLGNPQEKFRSIHIAGTNGKGSTAAMIGSILKEAGYVTGLFTSPHLEDFCERIQVNGDPITPSEVMAAARVIRDAEDEPLTFFELATALGFLHFAQRGVEIAVLETGLGGRLDATNVVTPMVSVITSIGRDHMEVLGESIEEIAFEKAGIIKPATPVVVGSMPAEAMEVIREQATVKGSRFVPIFMNLIPPNMRVGLEGDHQRRNAALAMSVIDVLSALGTIRVAREVVWRGLDQVRWPGRLETVATESEGPWILLDGAHNPEAMSEVRRFLEEKLQGRCLKVIFGAMADKDARRMFAEILPLTSELILTSPNMKRAADPETLSKDAGEFLGEIRCYSRVDEALRGEMDNLSDDDVLLITGSFFVVGEARAWFRQSSM